MSQMEFHIGRADLIAKGKNEAIEVAKELLQGSFMSQHLHLYEDEIECLLYAGSMSYQFFYHKETESLYKLQDKSFEDDYDIIEAETISPTSFEYRLKFYNGGTCFEECLEEAFNKIQR